MPLDVEITEAALDTLRDLDREPRERIVSKVEEIVDFPAHYLDPLTNFPGYKLRVGDFRVVVDWDRETDVLYVVAILERKHDYRELSSPGEVWGNWREELPRERGGGPLPEADAQRRQAFLDVPISLPASPTESL